MIVEVPAVIAESIGEQL